MARNISSMAHVDPQANLADDVVIGPFCFVGPDVTLGAGTVLENHVTIKGNTRIGARNHIHPGAVIGGEPQDLSYRGSPTGVIIGDDNIIRESVTINRGTEKDRGVTTVGSHCYLMACSHIAHDCAIGDHVIIANGTMLGGHVQVHDHASLSGAVAVHHFATIGQFSFVGGVSRLLQDAPPFMLLEGVPARPRCVNLVALKRNNFSREAIEALAEAHRLLYRARVGLDNAREILRGNGRLLPQVNHLLSFVECQHEGRHGRAREVRRAA
jgi:UDP-N-acetylglucosamine acyltransferase